MEGGERLRKLSLNSTCLQSSALPTANAEGCVSYGESYTKLSVSLRRKEGLAGLKLFFSALEMGIIDVGLAKEILVSMLDVLTGYS